METPRFKHSCASCMFLGQEDGYDLYACPQGYGSPTVIARRSSEPSDYASGLPVALRLRHDPGLAAVIPYGRALVAALERAEYLGIL
jgi:hypothetical protein